MCSIYSGVQNLGVIAGRRAIRPRKVEAFISYGKSELSFTAHFHTSFHSYNQVITLLPLRRHRHLTRTLASQKGSDGSETEMVCLFAACCACSQGTKSWMIHGHTD